MYLSDASLRLHSLPQFLLHWSHSPQFGFLCLYWGCSSRTTHSHGFTAYMMYALV